MLTRHEARYHDNTPSVTIGGGKLAFIFNVAAVRAAALEEIMWMYVYTDPEERLIVFEPIGGRDKGPGMLKLGNAGRGSGSSRRLIAKSLINGNGWVKAVADKEHIEDRKFELKSYRGDLPKDNTSKERGEPPWYIQLMPAFEQSIRSAEIGNLPEGVKGIYRYRGGNDGKEIIYIGKGSIRARYQQETQRKEWSVSRIEYSVLANDEEAYEWENYWLNRHREENNGALPRYNKVG